MKTTISLIASSVVGLVSGGFIGMLIAGNYAVNLQFLEARGYEAGMYWGGIAGLLLGMLTGMVLTMMTRSSFKETGSIRA
jgi:hypothetical protein